MTEFPGHYNRDKPKRTERKPPQSWATIRKSVRFRWLVPIFYIDWLADWAVYVLSLFSFLELLEYCGSFSILIAVIFYFVDAPQRTKLRHYQAWQVINTAQGKGGSGGRVDALHELNEDHVPLVGVDLADAFLEEVELPKADLRRSTFDGADLKRSDLSGANLEEASCESCNLRDARLAGCNVNGVNFTEADLNNVDFSQANLKDAKLERADLRDADLRDVIDWKTTTIKLADIHGVRNAPAGFVDWAMKNGAVDLADDAAWNALLPAAHATPTTAP